MRKIGTTETGILIEVTQAQYDTLELIASSLPAWVHPAATAPTHPLIPFPPAAKPPTQPPRIVHRPAPRAKPAQNGQTMTCIGCGASFIKRRKDQRKCSADCPGRNKARAKAPVQPPAAKPAPIPSTQHDHTPHQPASRLDAIKAADQKARLKRMGITTPAIDENNLSLRDVQSLTGTRLD